MESGKVRDLTKVLHRKIRKLGLGLPVSVVTLERILSLMQCDGKGQYTHKHTHTPEKNKTFLVGIKAGGAGW